MGDYQARFCEGLRVKFPRSTRQRFWRTIKQEYVYLYPAEDGKVLFKGLKKFLDYYNNRRTHRSLDRKTPFDWYEYAA